MTEVSEVGVRGCNFKNHFVRRPRTRTGYQVLGTRPGITDRGGATAVDFRAGPQFSLNCEAGYAVSTEGAVAEIHGCTAHCLFACERQSDDDRGGGMIVNRTSGTPSCATTGAL